MKQALKRQEEGLSKNRELVWLSAGGQTSFETKADYFQKRPGEYSGKARRATLNCGRRMAEAGVLDLILKSSSSGLDENKRALGACTH